MTPSLLAKRLVALGLAFTLGTSPALACTGIGFTTKDGASISGRTAEFGVDLELNGLFIPRGQALTGTLPDGGKGLAYTGKYAALGTDAYGENAIIDGLNEKGLAAAAFYFPSFAGYASPEGDNKAKAVSPTQFVTWILTQFATLDEVKAGLKDVVIVPTTPKGWSAMPPMHYVVYDKSGKAITIEPIDGSFKVYDNPIGVLTNSPTFDWHLVNLSNYVNLSPFNAPTRDIDGSKFKSFSQGSGLRGLPGDFTSPSRFVRAAVFSATAIPSETPEQGVAQAFHILNQFDIPYGAVRSEDSGKMDAEWTLGTVVRDQENLVFYIRTYDNPNVRMISMKDQDLDGKEMIKFDIDTKYEMQDLSGAGTPF
ncbi:choloylglycine hydrolase family protein [Methyloligella sp. 2.7D]|uniref:linear amide C-N hydrolase n=1 Tax=unclassified Methyloligella TaxID=2625955 RepID=UPI00157D8901|nr:choloylglycine hydrolase family protein [Methyloligella sp. GL2]QKP76451.1 choloylglycine hydrolase family protein [Methyloligella sp. GL2]